MDLCHRCRTDWFIVRDRPHDHRQPGPAQHRTDHLRHHHHRTDRPGIGFPVQGFQRLAVSVENGMTTLRIDQVSRTFPARQGNVPTRALEPTDLSVGNNDFVTILGPSGCGKSTLLRIIAGLDRPTSGRVILDGEEITGPGADRGMVFQSYTLFPWLTVRDNIAYGPRERGVSQAERDRIADGFIDRVGLSGFE